MAAGVGARLWVSVKMNLLIILVVLIVVVVAVAILAATFLKAGCNYKSKNLLTENEKEFFFRLKRALSGYEVFPQVSMGAILIPNANRNDRRYHQIRGSFSQKIVDFLICDGKTLKAIAIVELDDRTHNIERDQKRDAMLLSAGYRVIRWDSRKKPSEDEIRERIQQMLSMPSCPARNS